MQSSTGVRFETVFLDKDAPDDDVIEQLIYWCKRFDKLNLAPKSAGNLSVRTKKGFIITATGVALGAAERDNLVEVVEVKIKHAKIVMYVKGKVVPSKESVLHSEIYRSRPGINTVFHVHDQLVVGLAGELDLPCTEGEQPRGSYELTTEVQRVLELRRNARYLVLRNHGVIAIGETMAEAGKLAEDMNKLARNLTRRKGVKNARNARI